MKLTNCPKRNILRVAESTSVAKASMIRIPSLIFAMVVAQAIGQSVCHCQITEHSHHHCPPAVENDLREGECDFLGGCRCLPSTDEQDHHCDCQSSLQLFMTTRVNVDRDLPLVVCDASGVVSFFSYVPELICRTPAKPVMLRGSDAARAELGRWML